MDQALNSQKTPHTSPLRASYGMSFVSILMKNDRVIKGFYCNWRSCCKIAFRWITEKLINEKSTLDQVMPWSHQETSHYLSQCWPRSMRPYGITRPQWVKLYSHKMRLHCQSYNPTTGFYTKGRPLIKSNLICPSDRLSWQPGCPVLIINIQGNFCISQGNGSSDNLPENLV